MKILRNIAAICMLGFTILIIQSCSKSDGYTANGGDNTMVQKINIQGMQFQPATVTVLVGTKITWTNLDTDAHTVTSDDATSFSSANLSTGSSFSFTTTANGTYQYHCSLHPSMVGTIYVVNR